MLQVWRVTAGRSFVVRLEAHEGPFRVYLEPEGMDYEVTPERSLDLRFPCPHEQEPWSFVTGPSITWHPDGLVIWRPLAEPDPPPVVTYSDGEEVDGWG